VRVCVGSGKRNDMLTSSIEGEEITAAALWSSRAQSRSNGLDQRNCHEAETHQATFFLTPSISTHMAAGSQGSGNVLVKTGLIIRVPGASVSRWLA
jgi:hypothetical protein